jgi:flagellar basal-body rod modification protein FlgD
MTITGTGIRTLADLNPASSQINGKEALGKDQFLKLMIAQLKHQDPLDPAKNEQFLAQLAQFSSLEGITNLNESVSAMAASMRSTVTSEASSLVGRSVLVPTDQTLMQGHALIGNVNVSEPTDDLVVEISDRSGANVRRLSLGAQEAGTTRFTWDGANSSGEPQAPGVYRVKAYANGSGSAKQFPVDLPEYVVSVSLGKDGMLLNLAGGSTVPVTDVKEIQ